MKKIFPVKILAFVFAFSLYTVSYGATKKPNPGKRPGYFFEGKTNKSYPAAWFSLNGDGEMTGLPYIEDYGMGYGPIGITNTNSVGIVRDAIGQWCVK